MEKAIEQQIEQRKVIKEERVNNKKERYNGKVKRREWVQESEDAKRVRLAENPVDRVKRRKSIILVKTLLVFRSD